MAIPPKNLNMFLWRLELSDGFKMKQSLFEPDSSLPLGV